MLNKQHRLYVTPHNCISSHSPLGSISYSCCGSLQEVVTDTEAAHTSPVETLTHKQFGFISTHQTATRACKEHFAAVCSVSVFTFFIFVWSAHHVSTNLPLHFHLGLKERVHQLLRYVSCSEIHCYSLHLRSHRHRGFIRKKNKKERRNCSEISSKDQQTSANHRIIMFTWSRWLLKTRWINSGGMPDILITTERQKACVCK